MPINKYHIKQAIPQNFDKTQDETTSELQAKLDSKYVNHGSDGEGTEQLDYVDFDLTANPTHTEGRISWNDTDKTLDIHTEVDATKIQVGQEMVLRVTNKTGVTISNGAVVYISGAQGSRPTIALADADTAATSDATIGVVTADIADNATGYVTVFGLVRDIDTSAFTAGDVVYVSSTAGALTNTAPASPAHRVKVGTILFSNAESGLLLVEVINGEHLENLHDVLIDTPADNQGLIYESASSLWKNKTITGSMVTLSSIGNATYDDVQTMQDIYHSSGLADGGVISNNGDGTYAVSAGSGYLRASTDPTTTLFAFDFSANNSITPSDGINYVGIEYNAGSPQVVQRSTENWDLQTAFPIGQVVKEGATLHIFNGARKVGDHAGKMIDAMIDTMPFARDSRSGGLILGETGTRNVTLTAGAIWYGLVEYTISAIDTSASDTFEAYYRDGAGGWTLATGQTQWNNSQYDNNSGTLQALTSARYAVNWFYVDVEGDLVMIYPQNQYNTLAQAVDATPPATLPDRLLSHGRIIGRIVFQEGASSASSIESVFDTTFGSTAVTSHNNLAGLQGGTAGEYYHLTNVELGSINQVKIDAAATAGYIGATSGDGVLRTSSPITYADGGSFITLGVDETAINHDNLLGFVTNEHIDHTSVTLTAGEGLTGGGDISSSRSFALDFSDLSTTDTAVGATDLVSIHDGAQKKITFANFEGSLNHDNLTGFVTNEHIDWTNASSNFLTTGSVTGRGTTQFGDASNYVQVSNVGILTMAGTAEYRVASDKAAFKAVADTDAGLFFGVTGGARYYYTDIDGVEMFSIGASTAASGNVTLYGNLAFSSGNYTVADNNYAFVSTTDNDIGLFFDGTNFRINMRDNLAADVWGVTIALTDKGAMRWLPRQTASDTAPVDDLTIKKLTIQKLSSAPTNAAYIAFTNNPGTDTFYLVLEEG